jgi:hypothetical protein
MDLSWLLLVRLVHIVCASIWFGSTVFATFFLAPTIRDAGESGRGFMQAVNARGGVARFVGPIAGLTILSGLLLYWRAGYLGAPFASTSSTLLTLGAALALAGWLYGILANVPLQRKMRAAPPEEARAMQATMMRRGRIVGIVVIAAFVLMVGRNVVSV